MSDLGNFLKMAEAALAFYEGEITLRYRKMSGDRGYIRTKIVILHFFFKTAIQKVIPTYNEVSKLSFRASASY